MDLADRFAFFGPVTGLPNQMMLTAALQQALTGERAEERQFGPVWLSVDRFKDVSDAFGQAAGNRLLRALAGRLSTAVRAN